MSLKLKKNDDMPCARFMDTVPLHDETKSVRGGILADFLNCCIGLGKTVEVIACILSNPPSITLPINYTRAHMSDVTTECTRASLSCFCNLHIENAVLVNCIGCQLNMHVKCLPTIIRTKAVYPYQNVYCPYCVSTWKPLECKTTLIISPKAIHKQWVSEIQKHTHANALKIYVYNGVRRSSPSELHPAFLATFDVIITT